MSALGYNVLHDFHSQRQPSSSPVMHRSTIPGSNSGAPTPFKAPAHKHAHHLHSIPPREKSTRTLIIDHLLWVHARTRFAQARAELGMTDRTGGHSSANYIHRERPENYEEDEEMISDGEDIITLTARAGGPGHPHSDEEDERLDMQDVSLARKLRQRAESVEKVATSMLDQPPSVPPIHPDDLLDTPTSPSLRPQNHPKPHKLPNGVRLRLALATVVNDLFSRRAPSAPDYNTARPASGTLLPPALIPLFTVSSAPPPSHRSPSSPRRSYPNDYIRSLYVIGADPDTQNSPPSLRCPRHLHMGCEICVEAKSLPSNRSGATRGRSTSGRAGSTTGSSPGDVGSGGYQNTNALVGGVTGWQDGSGIGSGLARPGQRGTVLRRPSDAKAPAGPHAGAQDTGPAMSNTKLAELIVRFMRLSALVAMELGREATEDRASVDGGERREEDASAVDPSGSSNSRSRPDMPSPQTSPRALIHRHLAEAGMYYHALRPTREWYFLMAGLLTRAVFEGYMTAGWRGIEPLELLLGVGLGISQAQGTEQNGDRSRPDAPPKEAVDDDDLDEDFSHFDPDDLPNLDDAAKVLFPSLRDPGTGPGTPFYRREGAELEYQVEMSERLSRFYDFPRSTPDLATHMEDLAWQFPAEAVERASVRFCEAVARWRGKPELETYKKVDWVGRDERRTGGGTAMSIDALVHSNPTSPSNDTSTPVSDGHTPGRSSRADFKSRKPSIHKYFSLPPSVVLHGRKRRRSETDRADESRRPQGQVYT